MGRVTLTVADIRHPTEDRKRGGITGTDGTRLGCFAENIGKFQIGQTYDVEFTDGQYPNVRSVKPATSAPAPTPFVSGAYRQSAPVSAPAAGHPSTPPSKEEQIWVQGLLQTFIRAGEVTLDRTQLLNATRMLLWVHKEAFRREVIQQHMEAAE